MARTFEFDLSTMGEETIAPDDEMRGMFKMNNRGSSEEQPNRLSDSRKHLPDIHNKGNTHASTADDEDRIPPPMDDNKDTGDITNADSSHPDFDAWKREMTKTLLSETVATSSTKSRNSVTSLKDLKTTRINKRRFENKVTEQLLSIRSDTSTTSESESSDERSSDGTSSNTKPVISEGKDATRNKIRRKSKGAKTFTKPTDAVYVIKDQRKNPRNREQILSQSQEHSIVAPQSPAPLDRTTASTEDVTLLSKLKPNSTELGTLSVELKELKSWVQGTSQMQTEKHPELQNSNRLRQTAPPLSPKSSDLPTKSSAIPSKEPSTPPVPKSIVVPRFVTVENKYKTMIESAGNKDQGIPSDVVTTQTSSTSNRKTVRKNKKKKKRVRFHKPLITETKYRPKTPRKDIDTLYFQEDELLVWEKDEMTTLRERFEIALSEFKDSRDEHDEETEQTDSLLSYGTPVISFHDSFSYSFNNSSDEESTD